MLEMFLGVVGVMGGMFLQKSFGRHVVLRSQDTLHTSGTDSQTPTTPTTPKTPRFFVWLS